jgi:hypothetical protein
MGGSRQKKTPAGWLLGLLVRTYYTLGLPCRDCLRWPGLTVLTASGLKGTRTLNLPGAGRVLSQLSYEPYKYGRAESNHRDPAPKAGAWPLGYAHMTGVAGRGRSAVSLMEPSY